MVCFYVFYDVFIEDWLKGNLFVVVLEVEGFLDEVMQVIVVEFNLLEMVFVFVFENFVYIVWFRIFMFGCELFFVGYFIVGMVIVLVEWVGVGQVIDQVCVLEEKVGLVCCVV